LASERCAGSRLRAPPLLLPAEEAAIEAWRRCIGEQPM